VQHRAIGRSVVRQHALDPDAVASEEAHGTAEERDRRLGRLVCQHLGVGQTRRVVDCDVDVFPAGLAAPAPRGVGEAAGVVLLVAVAPALAGATLDPAELLMSTWMSSPGRLRS
jgi:hypothetical protein